MYTTTQCTRKGGPLGKLKNITLSADEQLIAAARKKAHVENTTLNEQFRKWLEQFTRPISSRQEYQDLMESLSGKLSGTKFNRERANDR